MWLSRLALDVRSPSVRRAQSDVNALHQHVLAAFPSGAPSDAPRRAFGVLFRLDRTREGSLLLLIQSTEKPDLNGFARDGWLAPAELDGVSENPAVKAVDLSGLSAGQVLRFRLRANPTKKVDTKSGPDGRRRNGRRVVLTSEAERRAWLDRKGLQHGFRILDAAQAGRGVAELIDVSEGRATGYRLEAPEGHRTMTFGSALFDGRLQVTDAALFREAVSFGIGSGKAFGFGLLSIAPG